MVRGDRLIFVIYGQGGQAIHSALFGSQLGEKRDGTLAPEDTYVKSMNGWLNLQNSVTLSSLHQVYPPKNTFMYVLNGN
jgi:hypothetical protein